MSLLFSTLLCYAYVHRWFENIQKIMFNRSLHSFRFCYFELDSVVRLDRPISGSADVASGRPNQNLTKIFLWFITARNQQSPAYLCSVKNGSVTKRHLASSGAEWLSGGGPKKYEQPKAPGFSSQPAQLCKKEKDCLPRLNHFIPFGFYIRVISKVGRFSAEAC
jgi:hypothetical protein